MITALPPQTRLDEQEAADYLGIAKETLRDYRNKGIAPKFTKVGRKIQYRVAWLEEYIDQQTEHPII